MTNNKWIAETRAIELRAIPGLENSFEGLACRYGVEDSYGTTFVTMCFTRGGLDNKGYALLWMHDPNRPVGTFTAVERKDGLYIVGTWDDTTAGRDARMAAMSGSAGDLSVGFTWYKEPGSSEDSITIAKLQEVSQVTSRFGAVPGSVLTAVRAAAEATEDRWTTEYPNEDTYSVPDTIEQGTPEAEEAEVADTDESRAALGELTEGDFVTFLSDEELQYGRVEYIMNEGQFGVSGDPLSFIAEEDNPFAIVRLYDEDLESGFLPTGTFVGKMFAELTKFDLVEDNSSEDEILEEDNTMERNSRIIILARYIKTLF
jgi:HK97 family phage prohead protease